MSYYTSSSFLNNSTTVYTYPSTTRPSAYSSNYSSDLYRSYSNLRVPPREITHYNQPPSFLALRRPTSSTRNESTNTNSTKINIETINSDKNNNLNQTTTKITILDTIEDSKKPNSSRNLPIKNNLDGRSSSSSNLRIDITDNVTIDGNNNSNLITTITTTGPAPNNVAITNSTHTLNGSSGLASNNNNDKDDKNLSISTRISPFRASKDSDLIATAVSNLQLNCTDDLMTQVDYYLNEADNRMICSGKQVEIEGFDLQSKSTLISKCIYIQKLLADANLSETNLDTDPIFTKSGKAVLLFISQKDAEGFARKHSGRFSVSNVASNERGLESPTRTRSPTKKNVHFIENDDVTVNVITSSDSADDVHEFNNKSRIQHSKSSDSILSRNKLNNDNDNVVAVKKNKPEGGYEILTIRAKLKQKVGQNRSNQVTLGDIDLIMRNVVTIIQDEFMKRFPSSSDSN